MTLNQIMISPHNVMNH